VKDFSFGMFYNKTETFKKLGYYIVTTEEMRVRNVKRFVLRNEETIIYKRNDRHRNIEIF